MKKSFLRIIVIIFINNILPAQKDEFKDKSEFIDMCHIQTKENINIIKMAILPKAI